jgi:hypothetical protein
LNNVILHHHLQFISHNQSAKKNIDLPANPEQAVLFAPWNTVYRKSHVKYSATASSANLIGFKASYENFPAAQLSIFFVLIVF